MKKQKTQKRAAFSPSAELLWCKVFVRSHEENKKEKTQKNTKKRSARAARAARYRPLQRGVRAERACKFYIQRCRKEADLCRTHMHRGVELTRTEVSNLHTEVSWGHRTTRALANP